MAARLGLSPDLRLGQGSSSQPPSGLAPSVSGAGTSGSRSEEQGQTEGVLDHSAEVVEVIPGSQVELPVPQEPLPVPTAQEGDPRVVVAAPGQSRGVRSSCLFPKNRCPCRLRRRVILGSSWLRLGSPSLGRLGRPRRGWYRSWQRGRPRRYLRGSRFERPPHRHG